MKEQIKIAIMSLLELNKNYSFHELIIDLRKNGLNVSGDGNLYIKKNLILWHNISTKFISAIEELVNENKIILKPLNNSEALVIYAYTGIFPDLPMAETIKAYSEPHWLPVLIKLKNIKLKDI